MFRSNVSTRRALITSLSTASLGLAPGIGLWVAGDQGFLYDGLVATFLAVIILGRGLTTASWWEVILLATLVTGLGFGKPLLLGDS